MEMDPIMTKKGTTIKHNRIDNRKKWKTKIINQDSKRT